MSKFVFVLGAGASADSGAPTSNNFMDRAESFLGDTSLGGHDRDAFELVFKARNKLKDVLSKATLDLDNLEVLFNAFEMAALFNRLGDLATDDVRSLPGAMRRVIARTIERSQIFPLESAGYRVRTPAAPLSYSRFAALVEQFSSNKPSSVSVLTFNYDLALDLALSSDGARGIPFDYALEEASSGKLELLKLHGSLNWHRCKCEENIGVCQFEELFEGQLYRPIGAEDQCFIECSLQQPVRQHCAKQYDLEPFIIPPTWNKGHHHSQLSNVWRRAARHFSEAEYIFIVGYSYPLSDEFFRYLYALGSVGDSWLKQILVFNPDGDVNERIRGLLGPLVAKKFVFDTRPFGQAIPYLAQDWYGKLKS